MLRFGNILVGFIRRSPYSGIGGWDFDNGYQPIFGLNTEEGFWGISRALPRVVFSNVLFEVGEDQARVDEEKYISEGRSPLPKAYGKDMKQLIMKHKELRIMRQKELMSNRVTS